MRAANQSGGKDNITVILFRLGEGDPAGEPADDRAAAGGDEDTVVGLRADELQAAASAPAEPAADATIIQRRPRAGAAPPPERPRRQRRRGRGRLALRVVLGLAVLAAVVGGLYALSRQVYFVGTNDAGLVTVYRGIPYELPLGINLYTEDYASGMPARAIPTRAPRPRPGPRVAQPHRRRRPRARARARTAGRRSARTDVGPHRASCSGSCPSRCWWPPASPPCCPPAPTDVSNATLTYGAFFLGLCVVGHLFIRARLPDADPYMFPLAAVLAGIGLVLIYRIDPELAREQAQWFVVGLALFCLTILLIDDHHVLERYRYTIAAGEHRAPGAAAAPRHRGAGERRLPGDQGRADPVPAGGVRQARDHHLPRELPARDGRHPGAAAIAAAALPAPADPWGTGAADAPGHRRVRPRPAGSVLLAVFLFSLAAVIRDRPSPKHFGPLLLVWGLAMLMLIVIRDLGSSLMFFGGFLALL